MKTEALEPRAIKQLLRWQPTLQMLLNSTKTILIKLFCFHRKCLSCLSLEQGVNEMFHKNDKEITLAFGNRVIIATPGLCSYSAKKSPEYDCVPIKLYSKKKRTSDEPRSPEDGTRYYCFTGQQCRRWLRPEYVGDLRHKQG